MNDLSETVREQLVGRFPKLFSPKGKQKKPIKVGIHEDILKKCPELSLDDVKLALRNYTGGPTYLENIKLGQPRFDLDGQPAGTIEDKDVNYAFHRMRSIRKRWRKTAVEKRAQRRDATSAK